MLPKPGVMDPVAQSAMTAIADLGLQAEAVRTLKKFAVGRLARRKAALLCSKVLANDAIEQVIVGPLDLDRLEVGSPYRVPACDGADPHDGRRRAGAAQPRRATLSVAGRNADDPGPFPLARAAIRPTWSWKPSPKRGASIAATRRWPGESTTAAPSGERHFQNMLKETIFAATQQIRHEAGRRTIGA